MSFVPVVQIDRDAAVELYGSDKISGACIASGSWDETPILQIFARHRLAVLRDSGSGPSGGDAVAAPGNASQSGGAIDAASPDLPQGTPQ
jgi:hypothetical protein